MNGPDWVLAKRKTRRGKRQAQYPFATMAIASTFVLPVDEQTCTFESFRVMASRAGTELGRKFYVRKRHDGAFECWRDR